MNDHESLRIASLSPSFTKPHETGTNSRFLRLLFVALIAVELSACSGGASLEPVDPYQTLIDATSEYELVALGEFHQMQEWHDFMAELLQHDEFVANIDDIVVEFGNGLYQDVADRYLLELQEVQFAELSQIWRNTIGGGVLWDAPVYEQFFRNVRAVNEGRAPEQRLRVLLGDPEIDFDQIQDADDMASAMEGLPDRDAYFADIVNRHVIAAGRHAVLIAGADHLRRGVHANTGPEYPNVATLLAEDHADDLFIVYPLPYWYEMSVWERLESELHQAPRPSIAFLDGTWLGDIDLDNRALVPDPRFGDQVDAVIWFGLEETLTRSQADVALYQSGEYASELRRRSELQTESTGEQVDYIAEGLRLASSEPTLR